MYLQRPFDVKSVIIIIIVILARILAGLSVGLSPALVSLARQTLSRPVEAAHQIYLHQEKHPTRQLCHSEIFPCFSASVLASYLVGVSYSIQRHLRHRPSFGELPNVVGTRLVESREVIIGKDHY